MVTFTANQAMLRLAGPEVFGVAAIQLELLLSTLLFLSREGLRLAIAKLPRNTPMSVVINVSWLPAVLMLVVAAIIGVCPWFELSRAASMYCLAACLESMGEPWYNAFNHAVDPVPRLTAETMAVLARSVTTLVVLAQLSKSVHTDAEVYPSASALDAFGLGQVAFGAVYLGVLVGHAGRVGCTVHFSPRLSAWGVKRIALLNERYERGQEQDQQVLTREDSREAIGSSRNTSRSRSRRTRATRNRASPKKPTPSAGDVNETVVDRFSVDEWGLVRTTLTTTSTSFLKHILTESDKIVLSLLASNYNQGVYAVASNYGSLMARVAFLPVEEGARMLFAKQASAARAPETERRVSRDARGELMDSLCGLLQLVVLVGLMLACFGPPFVMCVVEHLLGRRWDSEDTVSTLTAYCFYLLVLAVNGVSEAFVHATFLPERFGRVNFGLAISSIAFAMLAYPLVSHWGTAGVVVANALAMAVRIVWNMVCISDALSDTQYYLGFVTPASTSTSAPSSVPRSAPRISALSVSSFARYVLDPVVGPILVMAVVGCYASSARYADSMRGLWDAGQHMAVGALAGLCVVFVLWQQHATAFRNTFSHLRKVR